MANRQLHKLSARQAETITEPGRHGDGGGRPCGGSGRDIAVNAHLDGEANRQDGHAELAQHEQAERDKRTDSDSAHPESATRYWRTQPRRAARP